MRHFQKITRKTETAPYLSGLFLLAVIRRLPKTFSFHSENLSNQSPIERGDCETNYDQSTGSVSLPFLFFKPLQHFILLISHVSSKPDKIRTRSQLPHLLQLVFGDF